MVFSRLRQRFNRQAVAWLLWIVLYKIIEDWALDWARRRIAKDAGMLLTVTLEYLPFLTWILAAGGLVWLTSKTAKGIAVAEPTQASLGIHLPPKESPAEQLELLERKFAVNKVFARVAGKVLELDIDAYDYYVELSDDQKKQIAEMTLWASRYQFSKREFIDRVDPRRRVRNRLNDFIAEGNHLVAQGPLPLSIVPEANEVYRWESHVREFLRQELPDREADFMRPVGTPPHGYDPQRHRIEQRLERLSHILQSI